MSLCRWCKWIADNNKGVEHEPHKKYLDSTCECRNHSVSTNFLIKNSVWRKI